MENISTPSQNPLESQGALDDQPLGLGQALSAPGEKSCCTPSAHEQSSNALCEQVWGVWQEHCSGLRRYLQHRIREKTLTDDVLSDVMLKVYKNCERLAEVKDVKAWLTRIAQNTLTDYYRKPKAHELPLAEVLSAAGESELLPEQRMAACLGEMLMLLPEQDRDPLQWADLEGLPQEEVARRLGLSISGAKSRIQRARQKLRQQIEACCQVDTNTHGRLHDFYPKRNTKNCS